MRLYLKINNYSHLILKYMKKDYRSSILLLVYLLGFLLEANCQTLLFDDIPFEFNKVDFELIKLHKSEQMKILLMLSSEKYNYLLPDDKQTRFYDSLSNHVINLYPDYIGFVYFFKSVHEMRRSNYREAFELAKVAGEKFRINRDTTGQINALIVLGLISNWYDKQDKLYVSEYLTDAYRLGIKSKSIEAQIMGLYAHLRLCVFKNDSITMIESLYFEALKIIKQNPKYEYMQLIFLRILAEQYSRINLFHKAYNYNLLQHQLCEKYKIPLSAILLNDLGWNCLMLKKINLSKIYYERVINTNEFKNTENLEVKIQAFYGYQKVLRELKEYKKASILVDSIYAYEEKLRFTQSNKNIEELIIKYELQEKKQEEIRNQKEKKYIETKNKIYFVLSSSISIILIITLYLLIKIIVTNEKLRKINQKNTKLTETRDYFYGIVAHDLRGAFISFKNMSSILNYHLERKDYVAIQKIITSYENTYNKLSLLLDNLLKWAISQKNVPSYNPIRLNVHEFIHNNILLFKDTLTMKKISITIECSKKIFIHADPQGLDLIFRNLMLNALKAIHETGEIKIKVVSNNSSVIIEFCDSGHGLNHEKLINIRNVFLHPNKYNPGENNLGLGMLLISRFVKINNGIIEIESIEGKGTTFFIEFPLSTISQGNTQNVLA